MPTSLTIQKLAVVKGEEVILRKRKRITDLLDEDAIATVSEKEVGVKAINWDTIIREMRTRAI